MNIKSFPLICCFMLLIIPLQAQQKARQFTISGYITEAGSGELLPGVTVYVPELKTGTSSNSYGFYSLTLQEGEYELVYSFVGFKVIRKQITLDKDLELEIELKEASTQLEAIEVVAEKQEKESTKAQMSTISLPTKQIQDIPAFLGEKDVMKVLQLMPGVQSGSEGSSGLYVRGGGPDQNLLILDDAVVYNANHLFGFFSVFNGDALKSVELYKGGFPARFGGRLSSVVKMDMKEGNKQEYHGKASLGLISSNLVVEGPLVKDKASFLISGRRTYLFDLLIAPAMAVTEQKVGYYFYDLNAKVNYDFGKKDKLYLSGYFGRDKFYTKNQPEMLHEASEAGLKWGNATGTLRWNHLYNNRLFSNTSLILSNYNFDIYMEDLSNDVRYYLSYNSGIRDISLKHDMDYMPNPRHQLRFGFQSTYHLFTPRAYVMDNEEYALSERKRQEFHTFESGVYIEDNFKPNERLNLEAGLRISHFTHNKKHYFRPEPRFSGAFMFTPDFSVKASFASMNQYIHLLTNSGIGLPTDLWVSSTDRVKPQSSQQVALGLAKDIEKAGLSLTLEGYYKWSQNVIGYKDGATFLMIEDPETVEEVRWEDNITAGKGWAYGVEFLVQRKYGKLTGWIGYTLSWTQLQFDEINFGKPFYAKYDRRHDASIVCIYKPHERITLSASWVYGTGNAYTMGLSKYNAPEHNVPPLQRDYLGLNVENYSQRNNFRAEAYHRMDASIQFHKKKKHGTRTWEISVYNLYNRKNPFFYYTEYTDVHNGQKGILKRVSLFPILPTVSYKYDF
jgi:outer membrane receptor protein involved in Fe transport